MHLWPSLSLKAVLWAAAWHLVSHVLSSSHRHVSGSYSSLISSDLDPRTRDSLLAFWRRELGQGRSDLSRSPQLITRRSSPSDALESAPSPEDSLLAGLLEGVPKYDTCAEPDGTIPPSLPGDAPWTQGQFSYEKSIFCPNGIQNSPLGVALLIPCTTASGRESWERGPYFLGLQRAGFDVCWITLPALGLADMQLSGEFVAYAIHFLARQSPATHFQISCLGFSQGGSNLQAAFTLYPSVRPLIRNAVALAAPFKGMALPLLGCLESDIVGGCFPGLMQLGLHSRYQLAINSDVDGDSGARAQVPLTSIYSLFDDVVYPQGPQGVSALPGASNIAIQDVCPGKLVDHYGFMTDSAAYGISLTALKMGKPITPDMVDTHYCDNIPFAGNLVLDLQIAWRFIFNNTSDRVTMILKELISLSVPSEPLLIEYICQRGYASASECTNLGFCNNTPRKGVVESLLTGSALNAGAVGLTGYLLRGHH